jgi:mono/diheme cytochrome c family protein
MEFTAYRKPNGRDDSYSKVGRMILSNSSSKIIAALAVLGLATSAFGQDKAKKVTYDDHVQSIFRQKCLSCHNAEKKSSGLDLSTYTNMMLGGSSGDVIEPGSAEDSYLFMLITHDSEPFMPPKSPKISDEMITTIQNWIDGGALENTGSKPIASKKPKFDLKMEISASERPAVMPLPPRLSLEPVMRTKRSGPSYSIATSPWAPVIAIAGQKQILLYDSNTLELTGVLPFPEGIPQVLKFSRSGRLLLAGGGVDAASGKVIVFDLTTGERVIEVGDELDTVLAADISSDQGLIALGGPGRIVRVYSTVDGSLAYEIRKHTDWVYSLEFSPDSILLATGDRAGGLYVWEAYTGREYLTLKGHSAAVTGISWRIDSNVVASSSKDSTARLWEMENGREIKKWNAHGGGTQGIEYTRDGLLVTCGRDRTAKLWDQNGSQKRAFEAFADIALSCSYCDESSRVIAGDWTGEIRVWNAADGVRVGNLTANPERIDKRLASAKVQFATANQEYQKRTLAHATALKKTTDAETTLKSKQTAMESNAAKLKETVVLLTEGTKKLAAENEKLKIGSATVSGLEKALPLIAEAVTQANKAIQAIGDDKELKDVVAKLQTVQTRRVGELDAVKKSVLAAKAAVGAIAKNIATYQVNMKNLETASATLKTEISALTKSIPDLKTASQATKAAVDEYLPTFTVAQQSEQRWQAEKVFAVKMVDVLQQRATAQELVDTRAQTHADMVAVLDNANSEMKATAVKMDVANKAVVDATTATKSLTQELANGTKVVNTLAGEIKSLDAKSTVLLQVLISLETAKKALAGSEAQDAQVKTLLASVNETVVGKQAALKTIAMESTAKKTGLEAAKVANVELKKKRDAAVVVEVESRKQVVVVKAEVTDVTTKQQEATKRADAAKQQLDLAQTQLAKIEEAVGELRQRTS